MQEYPDAALFTLHDCLLGDEGHIEAFEAVLRREYQSVFGVAPRLKVTPFAGG